MRQGHQVLQAKGECPPTRHTGSGAARSVQAAGIEARRPPHPGSPPARRPSCAARLPVQSSARRADGTDAESVRVPLHPAIECRARRRQIVSPKLDWLAKKRVPQSLLLFQPGHLDQIVVSYVSYFNTSVRIKAGQRCRSRAREGSSAFLKTPNHSARWDARNGWGSA